MTRLGDFTWNVKTPPASIDLNVPANIVRNEIPRRKGDITQNNGLGNYGLNVQGILFDQSGSTREAQRDSLFKLYYDNNPMGFCTDVDSTFGFTGDAYSEATTNWTATNCTLATDATYYKVGTKSLKITGLGGSNETLKSPTFTAINCNLPHYSSLCFWLRVPAVTTANNITVQVYTSAGNYYYRIIDLDTYLGGWTANTWKECILPLGSVVSADWTSSGSPDWESITYVTLAWAGAASDTVYLDGFAVSYGTVFDGIPLFDEESDPSKFTYEINLRQYQQ